MSDSSRANRLYIGIASTFLSKFWGLVAMVVVSPFYVRILGADGFAVVGISMLLLAIMAIFDSGLTPLAMREMADERKGATERVRSLRHFEFVFCGVLVAVLFCFLLVVYALGPLTIGRSATAAIRPIWPLILVDVCGQMVIRFYVGCLQGLDKHITANLTLVAGGICRSVFVIPLMLLTSPTLTTFFGWQALTSLCFVWIYKRAMRAALSSSQSSLHLSVTTLKSIVSSAMGLSLVGVAAAVFGQLDKFVFVRVSPLTEFAAYSFAASLAATMPSVALTFFAVFLPKYVRHRYERGVFQRLYASTFAMVGMVSAVLAAHLICYSGEIHEAVFHGSTVSGETRMLVGILAVGGAFSSLTVVPYAISVVDRRFLLQGQLLVITLISALGVFPLAKASGSVYWVPLAYVFLQVQFAVLYVVVASRACVHPSLVGKSLALVLLAFVIGIVFTFLFKILLAGLAPWGSVGGKVALMGVSGVMCCAITALVEILAYRLLFDGFLTRDLVSFSEGKVVET